MKGYVVADKAELKVREYELYSGYYCGVCKSIGKRYGNLPRMVLSYDSAFLAIIISSLNSTKENLEKQHCLVHPVGKKTICVNNIAIDYAADMMLILAYHKLIDDKIDEYSIPATGLELLFRKTYKKLQGRYPSICDIIEKELRTLSRLEKKKSNSIDLTSDSFGRIMEAVFSGCEEAKLDEEQTLIMKNLGFHLGKWIYLIDAFDDIEENIKKKTYNPLFYRHNYDGCNENAETFRERIKEHTEFLLFHFLGEMGKAFDLIDFGKNKDMAANILYLGLYKKTEEVLKKGNLQHERSL